MNDDKKTRKQLIQELQEMRGRVSVLEESESELKGVVEALREAERRYRVISDNPLLMVYVNDAQGVFLDANDSALQLLGYTREELGQVSFENVVHPEDYPKATEAQLENISRGRTDNPIELRLTTKSGEQVWVEAYGSAIDKDPQSWRGLGIARDISERKRAEESLQESEQKYRELCESLPEIVCEVDTQGNITYVNGVAFDVFGYTQEDFDRGLNVLQMLVPEERDRAVENIGKVLAGEVLGAEEYVAQRKDSSPFAAMIHTSRVTDDEGAPVGFRGIVMDISERKQAEEALRESERKLRGFMDSAADTFLVLDSELNVTEINRHGIERFEEIGLKRKDVIGKNLSDIVPDLRESGRYDMYLDVVRTGNPLVLEDFVPHPRFGHMHAILKVFKVGTGLGIVATDITERKRTEEALKESEERLRLIFESVAEGIFVLDLNGNYTEVNERMLEIHGLSSKAEIIGKSCFELVAPRGMERAEAGMMETVERGWTGCQEYIGRKADGSEVPMEVSGQMLRDTSGNPVGIVGIATDIRERKRAEGALRESEEKFRSLVENAPALIIIADCEGKIQLINHTLPGVTPGDAVGKTIFEYVPAEHHDEMRRSIERVFETGEPCDYEVAGAGPEGTTSWYSTRAGPILSDRDVVGVTLVCTDVTERKQAERALQTYSERLEEIVESRTKALRDAQEQLVRQERLAMLGQLAGSVSHELRNPLGAIKNAAYFLNMALEEPDPEVKETLDILEREVAVSDRIIGSLLDFARPKPGVWRGVNINEAIQSALSYATVPENIQVLSHLDESLPEVLGDPDQLSQVFGNIVLNAVQAMSEGGQLVMKSEAPSPEWVSVSFEDTGTGISKDNLENVFEPLYTTRARGIGLGLALSKSIVERHGGTIEVQSEVGRGSTFTVRLPVGGGERGG